LKKGAPVHHAYAATRGRRPWCQEGDEEHGPALGAMWLGSVRQIAQWHNKRAELSGARRHDVKLTTA
jgi:hypothetical protein